MFSDELILPWLERLREELPGLELLDAHTHIGSNDPDGYSCSPQALMAGLELAGARSVVFPMHEPDGYPAANDAVIEAAADSGGRLYPFCRLDPRSQPLAEIERALERGALGIKLHPRAERFQLDDPALREVFALADERRLPVLVHAGRGIPALGKHALAVCERHPGLRLILAHAGICDLAWIWRAVEDHPNLFFDTAWWSPSDVLALFWLVPPGHLLFGSDAPYGTPAFTATMALRYALQAGLAPDQVRLVMGGQMERLLRAEDPLDAGHPPGGDGRPLQLDPLLERVHAFLMNALGQMFNGVEPEESLSLTELACEVGEAAPQASVCRSILALLEERRRFAAAPDAIPGGDGRPARFPPGIHLVIAAAGLARTPDVPLPSDPVPADVGEREA